MPPLDDPKHERFARLLYEGVPVREAYVKAGFKWNNGNAYRLKDTERIRTRVSEFHQREAMVAGLDRSFVLGVLMDVANRHIESNPAAAVAAAKLLGQTQALELFTEKSKQDINLLDMIQRAKPEDKEQLIKELSARLGVTKAEDLLDG